MVFNTKITDAGLNLIRDFLNGDAPTAFDNIGYGTGSTEPTTSDTALETEIGSLRTTTTRTKADKQNKYTDELSSSEGNGNTISELALFNAGAGGTMFLRSTFVGRSKTTSVALQTEVFTFLEQ